MRPVGNRSSLLQRAGASASVPQTVSLRIPIHHRVPQTVSLRMPIPLLPFSRRLSIREIREIRVIRDSDSTTPAPHPHLPTSWAEHLAPPVRAMQSPSCSWRVRNRNSPLPPLAPPITLDKKPVYLYNISTTTQQNGLLNVYHHRLPLHREAKKHQKCDIL